MQKKILQLFNLLGLCADIFDLPTKLCERLKGLLFMVFFEMGAFNVPPTPGRVNFELIGR
jgi:hypothetical protein